MLKICLCSDNHGDMDSINKILMDNPACDYYIHCGDSCVSPEEMKPFISVKGNNDWNYDYPKYRLLEIGGYKILVSHAQGYTFSVSDLVKYTKSYDCNILFFGHTHEFFDEEIGNVRLINPGSTYYNRDMTPPTYAIIVIEDDGSIKVKRIEI